MDPMFSLNNFDSEELLMIGHKWEQEHGRWKLRLAFSISNCFKDC
jgi:hypothetical protein